MLSPPCTMYSALQELWILHRMDASSVEQRMTEANAMLDQCMACAQIQIRKGRRLAFEHPVGATSWRCESVVHVSKQPGVGTVVFDQCMLGLVSKVKRTPHRNRTRIMTNCQRILLAFQGVLCDNSHEHCVIEGSEGGEKRSTHATKYPAPMAARIVSCV